MEGGIRADAPLDYAAFKIFPTQNRYEAFVCCGGKIEKLGSGLVEQLVLFLPEVKNFHPGNASENLKLQLPENLKGSTWFTKSTFARFLHIIEVPEFFKVANAIGDEMFQLEEARKFHLALYSQGNQDHSGSAEVDGVNSREMELTVKPELQTTSSDPTKNELLRAMDLRIAALREELASAFNVPAESTCSTKQIAEMVSFSRYFGATDLRNFLLKYLAVGRLDQAADGEDSYQNFSHDSKNDTGKMTDGLAQVSSPVNVANHVKYGASPAKAAQVERQNSSVSDDSSYASDDDQPLTERSRPLARSASPRRSASPMRRVQIGRSGSRRPTALAIKSLGYIPAREKVPLFRDDTGNSSAEDSHVPPRKTECNVSRMSVQDAINLFERKQRDQNSEHQKMRLSVDSCVGTNKSVLRRWSAGMGDSSTQCRTENSVEGATERTENSAVGETEKNEAEVKQQSDLNDETVKPNEIVDVEEPIATAENEVSCSADSSEDTVVPPAEAEEIHDRVMPSDDWNRRKEAELNQMLLRYQSMVVSNTRIQELPSEQRGGFNDHYKQKRDEKLRGKNSGKQAEKKEQFKVLQDILDKKKTAIPSKTVGVAGKQESLGRPWKSQKNMSPSIQPKKEASKPAVKKASPKAPLPATRKSWPSAPSPKTTSATPTKTPSGISSVGSAPIRRKSLPMPSPTQPSHKTERPEPQQKSMKRTPNDKKQDLKVQEEKKHQVVKKSSNVTKAKAQKVQPPTEDGSGIVPAKQSFYSKVTKKGSVVPLETKPFLRKGSRIGPGVGPVVKKKASQSDESLQNSGNLIPAQDEVVAEISNPVVKKKASQSDESLQNSGNLIPAQGEVVAEISNPIPQQQEVDLVPPVSDIAALEPEASINNQEKCENTENHNQFVSEGDGTSANTTEFPVEIQSHEVMTISPVAWVEIEEHQEPPVASDTCQPPIMSPTNVAPLPSSSPRIRHSLSQMLQEDNGESEISEWGKAENPPAVVYQKDVPKGLKRLLKFARKSKGDSNVTGWSSPSVFSEGEEDADEPKAASKRHADILLKKAAIQANGYGHQKSSFVSGYDGGDSSMRATDYALSNDLPSVLSNTRKYSSQSSHKLQEGRDISAGATSTKASRSFFSLSTFRSSKSNEGKLR